MDKKSSSVISYNLDRIIFFSFFLFLFFFAIFLFTRGASRLPIILISAPLILILLLNLQKYYLHLLIAALFTQLYVYGPLKIQVINAVAFLIFFYFLCNINSDVFNHFKLPVSLMIASLSFIFSILLSSINTIHVSFSSIYFFSLFLTFIFTGYVVLRSVNDKSSVERFLNFYFISIAVSCTIIILEIVTTSKIRAVGLIGYSIMDFSAITVTVLILKYFVMGNVNLKTVLITLPTLIVLITTLSRFAWIGFIISLIYGLIITYRFDRGGRQFLINKKFIIILTVLLILIISVGLGVHNIIFGRFSDVTFDFFEKTEEGVYIQNSLETRALIWLTAIRAFEANPITGIGYQMFSVVSEDYNVLPAFFYETFVQGLDPHNTMLSFLIETGIVGFCSYLAFIITVFYYSFRSIKISATPWERSNSIILNVIVFFIIVNSIYSGQYTMNLQAFFMYIFFGLSIGNYLFLKNKSRNTELTN